MLEGQQTQGDDMHRTTHKTVRVTPSHSDCLPCCCVQSNIPWKVPGLPVQIENMILRSEPQQATME